MTVVFMATAFWSLTSFDRFSVTRANNYKLVLSFCNEICPQLCEILHLFMFTLAVAIRVSRYLLFLAA